MSTAVTDTGPASAGPFFDKAASVVRFCAGAVLSALVLLICTEAALRSLANLSLGFAEEITGYFVVTLTFFGAALALRSGTLFRVEIAFDLLPERSQQVLGRLFVAAAFLSCCLLAWKSNDLVLSSLSRGKFAPTVLRTPLWIPQMMLPLGFSLIGLFLIEQFLLIGRRRKGAM